jgi:hypothetical protein
MKFVISLYLEGAGAPEMLSLFVQILKTQV